MHFFIIKFKLDKKEMNKESKNKKYFILFLFIFLLFCMEVVYESAKNALKDANTEGTDGCEKELDFNLPAIMEAFYSAKLVLFHLCSLAKRHRCLTGLTCQS